MNTFPQASNNPKIPQPKRVALVTMTPAINTPIEIDVIECLKLSPKSTAASEPVQAPVIGRGMATNNARPIFSYLSIILPRFRACSKRKSKNFLNMPILLRGLEIALRNNKIKGTGNRLPIIARKKA